MTFPARLIADNQCKKVAEFPIEPQSLGYTMYLFLHWFFFFFSCLFDFCFISRSFAHSVLPSDHLLSLTTLLIISDTDTKPAQAQM